MTRLLVTSLQGRTLLVIVENLDDLFKGLGDEGEKQWRAFLQENPVSATLATSQQLFDGVSRRESPFFGFFQIEHLRPLTLEEAVLLLKKIAELKGDAELAVFLQTPIGRSRVRALHHLSGGNHRIYIILSEFITRESLDELVGPFEKLMDELTPYYQARLSWLSPQQREIVEFLCRCRYAVPVKEIASQLLISHQTAAGQLKEIKEKGYVQGHAVGREARYELAEPLMRLSVEVKENHRQPIRLIIDFLRIWHSREQLEQRLQQLPLHFEVEREYVQHALREIDDSWTRCILRDLEVYQESGDQQRAIEALEELAETRGHIPDWIHLGIACQATGRDKEALKAFDRAIALKSDDAEAWHWRGIVLGWLGRHEEAVESYNRALVIQSDDTTAGYYRVVTIFLIDRWDEGFEELRKYLRRFRAFVKRGGGSFELIITIMFSRTRDEDIWKARLERLLHLYPDGGALTDLGVALIRSLAAIRRDTPSAESLLSWRKAWHEVGSDQDELRMPLRVFDVGISFLLSGDQRVLLDLVQEERQILVEALGLEPDEEKP